MHLVQILLPLFDNEGKPFSPETHRRVHAELTERFGGLTAFTRAPAEGLWRDQDQTTRDDIVVLEAMASSLVPLGGGIIAGSSRRASPRMRS